MFPAEGRERANVCLNDEKGFGPDPVWLKGGGDGRALGLSGGTGDEFFKGEVCDPGEVPDVAFFLLNGRRKDHSDSNCTAASSEGKYSRIVESSSESIRRSAKRMMKTLMIMRR